MVFIPGENPLNAAQGQNPNYDQIVASLNSGTATIEELRSLFDTEAHVREKFKRLSRRVSVRDGNLLLDNDPVDSALADQVLRFVAEGVGDWEPLVKFYENLLANPSQTARDGLYRYLSTFKFRITAEGEFVAYKGVRNTGDVGEDGTAVYEPTYGGPGIVNGEEVQPVRQQVGDIVEMPRAEVVEDGFRDCAHGLHVGSPSYAKGYGSVLLEVIVNPADVVSVPNHGAKARVCRYRIERVISGDIDGDSYYEGAVEAAVPDRVPAD